MKSLVLLAETPNPHQHEISAHRHSTKKNAKPAPHAFDQSGMYGKREQQSTKLQREKKKNERTYRLAQRHNT